MPIIETEQQTNQNVISGQEYLDAGATKELVGQLRGYAEGYNDGYDAGAAASGSGGGSGGSGSATAYAWVDNNSNFVWYTSFAVAPETITNEKCISIDNATITVGNILPLGYEKLSDTSFSAVSFSDNNNVTYTRDPTKDFTLW